EDLLAEVVHILAGRAHENRVELILNWPHREALPVLISDPLRLRQILLNLIGNAIKFTHDGHVLIHVRVQKRDKKYIYLRFEVHDTGIGIPKEKIEKIFNEFTQVDSSTTREYGGTGLGLAICKRLVERMDGKIGVQSSPGQGSTFWFEMRFALSATERSEDEAPAADPLHLNHDNILSGKNVLLVDDNVVNLEIISAYLVAAGMIVETANSGLDALKLLRSALDREQKFDLLVIDEAMPKMGGESLLEKIKAKPDLYGDAPCVLMTAIRKAHSSSASNDIALPQISKPVYPRDLLQTLRQIISGKMPSRNVKAQTVHETKSLQQFKSHVLIAEDDRVSQRMAAGILEALGCTYEIVNDGEEALNKLAQNPDAFDLVLMDWQMPNMDGHAAIREIRKTSWGKNINILALTANAIQGDREKCIKAGANDYLSKPVRIGDVSTVLMRYK
ncbi:MAG: response regulator, partial [Alphaproteobacteria bacterium]|nr:response regulator [Alphaproteobacteria bacterium]